MSRSLACLLLLLACACSSAPKQRLRNLPPDHDGPYTLWWSDDVRKETGSARDGRRHGEVRRFHSDGSLELRARFVDGLPEGRVEIHHRGGGLARVEQVDGGVVDGLREEFDPAGNLLRRTNFVRGARHGEELGWYPDGTPALERHWKRDLGVGRWVEYDEAGRLRRSEHRWVAFGREIGYLETVYAPSGRITVQTLLGRHTDEWSGRQTTWHDNGVQAGLVDFVGGKRQGIDRSWSRTGRLVIEGQRLDDLRHGVWTTWDDQGRVTSRIEYAHGEPVDPAGAEPEALSGG